MDSGPKQKKLDWQPDLEQAIKKAKVALFVTDILVHPQSEPELLLYPQTKGVKQGYLKFI